MGPDRSQNRLEDINERECRELLASHDSGRLGVVVAGMPDIFPVNYALDAAGAIVIVTVPGTKLAAALNNRVTFEVDKLTADGAGWSVVVHGVAHQTDIESLRFNGRRPESWVPGRTKALRISTTQISGRRLSNSVTHIDPIEPNSKL